MNQTELAQKPRQFPLGGLVLIITVTTLAIVFLFTPIIDMRSPYAMYVVILGVVMVGLAARFILYFLQRPHLDLFEIIVPLTALFALHYPIRALFVIGWPNLARVPLNWPLDSDYYLFQGLWTSAIGFLFFYLGYFWKGKDPVGEKLPRIPLRDGTERRLLMKTIVIYALGVYAFVELFRGGIGMRFVWNQAQIAQALMSVFRWLETLRYLGLLIAWGAWRRGLIYRVLSIVFLAINILIGIGAGSKNDIFVSVVAVLFAIHYLLRVRTQRLFWIATALVLVFLIVFFPLVQSYRQSYKEVLGFQSAPTIDELIAVARALDVAEGVEGVIPSIINRATWLNSIVMIRRWVPEYIDYQRGATFYSLLIGWIPRVIWPNKPILSLGWFMHNVIIGSQTTSNVGLTNIGEFYLNFGMIGVVVGMFIMGVFIRVVYLYTQHFSRVALYRTLLYFALFPSLLLSLQSGTGPALLGMVRSIALVVIVTGVLALGARSDKDAKPLSRSHR